MTPVAHLLLAQRRSPGQTNSSVLSFSEACHLSPLHMFKDGFEPGSTDVVDCVSTAPALEGLSSVPA